MKIGLSSSTQGGSQPKRSGGHQLWAKVFYNPFRQPCALSGTRSQIVLNVKMFLAKVTQQGQVSTEPAVAATSCVCMKIHSGKPTSEENKAAEQFSVWNMNSLTTSTYSLQATMAEIHYSTTPLRVQCATWEVVQPSSWFQQEHSVRTAGASSMLAMWFRSQIRHKVAENAAATFAGTRHRKLQLAEHHKTKQ